MASRGAFNSRLGFILAAAGSAVGLGNIWGFPFEVGKGGGAAFLVLYLVFCFVLCFPVMVGEIAIGRHTQRNPVGAFKALGYKKWSIVGYMGVLSGFMILSFYNVVAAWAFGYFIDMASGMFPDESYFQTFTSDWMKVALYGALFMSATALVVSRGVSGGIERAAKILMPVLLVFIIGLVSYAMTLPYASVGFSFYLMPDFSQLTPKVVYGALGQAFFSLSLGMGALLTYGSYLSKKTNIVTSAALITLCDVGVAFLAGLMMFPFVAYLKQGNVTEMQAVAGGDGFIFNTLPGIFETLGPVLGTTIGALFFLLLSFAAFTSTISLLEVPTSYAVDELKIKRSRATWIVAALVFALGIPSMLSGSFMNLVVLVANKTFLPLGGFLISVFVAWVWKKKNFNAELEIGAEGSHGSILHKYVDFMISYICPIILGAITLVTILENYFGIMLVS